METVLLRHFSAQCSCNEQSSSYRELRVTSLAEYFRKELPIPWEKFRSSDGIIGNIISVNKDWRKIIYFMYPRYIFSRYFSEYFRRKNFLLPFFFQLINLLIILIFQVDSTTKILVSSSFELCDTFRIVQSEINQTVNVIRL